MNSLNAFNIWFPSIHSIHLIHSIHCIHSIHSITSFQYIHFIHSIHFILMPTVYFNLYTVACLVKIWKKMSRIQETPTLLTDADSSRDENVVSRESRSQGSPPVFLVSIPVLISRLWVQKSRFQSWYQDSRFESLNSSLDIKTQFSKVLIPVSISRLRFKKSWIQPQYQDSNFKILILVSILRLKFQKSCFSLHFKR